ncbi:hypothetical protein Bca52824_013465 [Brassica carinata]|uniref:EGF-like calcium-binding domain-containing protein n=1 Tax=Brassica carinata TaxID=52824 RepID=A0A8X7VZM0_BRACI|nr:hypothetical protein Bca52824_013465 [Brassica carinata]
MTHLSLLLVLILASTNLTASRSSCPSHCGNISIPYPFGIEKGCYLNEWFAIQCNNSTSRELVPYLPNINKEVVKIFLPDPDTYGSLRIKTNITSMGCFNSSNETKFGEPLNFSGSPFTIGRSNIFQAIGCNYKATLTHLEPTVVGCISTCEPRKIGDHTSCRGNKCCQVDPPSEIGQVVGINMEEISSNVTRERGCRVAFLTDENQDPLAYREGKLTEPKWFYDRQYAILQLRWAIPMTNLSFINSMGCTMGYSSSSVSPCICTNNTNDQISSLGCACHKGYTGNPYILGGCKDIDECQLDKGNYENCRPQGGTCVNTQGSYQTMCRFWCADDGFRCSFFVMQIYQKAKEGHWQKKVVQTTLAAYFILAMEENRLVNIIDPQIRDECKLEQVTEAAQLARRCLKLTGKDRPSMREVSMELERIRSQSKDSKSNVHIIKNNAEEADIGVESCNKVAVSTTW